MNIYDKPGSRVVFTGRDGYPNQILAAQQKLTIGKVYTVKETHVGDWQSDVMLDEVEGSFNSVMFEDWEDGNAFLRET